MRSLMARGLISVVGTDSGLRKTPAVLSGPLIIGKLFLLKRYCLGARVSECGICLGGQGAG